MLQQLGGGQTVWKFDLLILLERRGSIEILGVDTLDFTLDILGHLS